MLLGPPGRVPVNGLDYELRTQGNALNHMLCMGIAQTNHCSLPEEPARLYIRTMRSNQDDLSYEPIHKDVVM